MLTKETIDTVAYKALRAFAAKHNEHAFERLVTAARNGEQWAIERVTFALGSIATITDDDGPLEEVKLAIIRNIRTEPPHMADSTALTTSSDARPNVNDEFVRFFKSLGYGVTYEGLRATGERWHEIYDNKGILCQVAFETPLAEFLADLPYLIENKPGIGSSDYWCACNDDDKLRGLLERVCAAKADEDAATCSASTDAAPAKGTVTALTADVVAAGGGLPYPGTRADASATPAVPNPQLNDRDLILEVIHDLDHRVLQAQTDGYPQGRDIEREQSAALRRLLERADDYLGWRVQDARVGRPR